MKSLLLKMFVVLAVGVGSIALYAYPKPSPMATVPPGQAPTSTVAPTPTMDHNPITEEQCTSNGGRVVLLTGMKHCLTKMGMYIPIR
ncbi:MAG: hypothetical protein HY537_18625 [Deltaproteobacteria bacterium]|nr:hypothetical protein [Deltaproteobacteria bacterium]